VGKHWTFNLTTVFRYFWLMAGFNSKMTFEAFASRCEELSKGTLKMADEDWAAWQGRTR
tara:strand:+ start:82 stop:258 length:177 start_codon:yes stop_codon:yes gene_type:complete